MSARHAGQRRPVRVGYSVTSSSFTQDPRGLRHSQFLTMILRVGHVLRHLDGLHLVRAPLGKGLTYPVYEPRIFDAGRAQAVSTGTERIIVVTLGFIPAPFRMRAEGVVWIPDEAIVRAGLMDLQAGWWHSRVKSVREAMCWWSVTTLCRTAAGHCAGGAAPGDPARHRGANPGAHRQSEDV